MSVESLRQAGIEFLDFRQPTIATCYTTVPPESVSGEYLCQVLYSLGGLILRHVDQAKYLGVTITEDLARAPHINNIAGNANAKIGFLWRNFRFCTRELREQAYFTWVRFIIEYSASVWDPHYNKDITTLDKVQRRASRFVVGERW